MEAALALSLIRLVGELLPEIIRLVRDGKGDEAKTKLRIKTEMAIDLAIAEEEFRKRQK